MPFDFDAAVTAPFRMQPGLRRLDPDTAQLTPTDLSSAALRAKLDVLQRHPAAALLVEPSFDPAPALRALMQQATTEHPTAFATEGERAFSAHALGWSVNGDVVDGTGPDAIGACLQALPSASRLTGLLCLAFAEDFAVIDGATARIPWLAVCLPSRWAPSEEIGRHFAEVHAPVAENQLLVDAGAHLARLVSGATRWERFVWSITPDSGLAQHPQHAPRVAWPPASDASALAAIAQFRTEHQTFIPLPAHGQAIFTIHVESRPLAVAIDSPERAARLHAALASMSDAVLAYRGLADARPRLLDWLAARAA